MDTGSNSYGHKFLELCKKVPLRILNGRMFGDLFGKLTCYTPLGSSCVDYCAVSPELFSKIRYFQVQSLLPMFSDHTPISLCLKLMQVLMSKSQIMTSYQNLIKFSGIKTWLSNF
jgi:hypothetical protein